MFRHIFVVAFAIAMTAGAFAGTTAILDAQIAAPTVQVA
jgi:hypothetical protein